MIGEVNYLVLKAHKVLVHNRIYTIKACPLDFVQILFIILNVGVKGVCC